MGLQLSPGNSFCSVGLVFRTSTAKTIRLHRQMSIGAVRQKISRVNGERFLAPGYGCVPRADWFRHYVTKVLPHGARFWYKADDGLW